jgi:hypothetical protein
MFGGWHVGPREEEEEEGKKLTIDHRCHAQAALPEDKLRGLANWFLKKAKSAQPGDAPRTIVARPNTSRGTAASARSDDAAESRIHLAEIAAKNVDLNKVDDDQLMEVKAVMEKEFSLRATAKGTAEFQYDVKKKFSQTEESGWDSESDSVDEEAW